ERVVPVAAATVVLGVDELLACDDRVELQALQALRRAGRPGRRGGERCRRERRSEQARYSTGTPPDATPHLIDPSGEGFPQASLLQDFDEADRACASVL